MKNRLYQWIMITLVIEVGALHLISARGEFVENLIMGWLFVGNFLLALLAALDIYRQSKRGWVISAFLALGSIAGYILSRTVGLPGIEVEPWFNPLGIISIAIEGMILFLLIWKQPWKWSEYQGDSISLQPGNTENSNRNQFILPAASLVFVFLVSLVASRWGSYSMAETHSMADLTSISQSEFEQNYGLQLSLVGVSMMGSVVDVRFKVLDVEKAQLLLEDPGSMPGLLIPTDNGTMIMPVHMHRHGSILKQGRYYVMFFPNPQEIVQTGTPIVLTFGNLALDSVIAR